MSNKKDLQALAENLVEEFYETQGAGVLKNLNKRTYGNLINGREDVLNSIKESLSDYTDEEGHEIGEKEKEEILHLVDREIWGYGIIDDLIHDKSISDIKIHNAENIRIKRNGKREGSDITFPSEGAYKSFVTRLLEDLYGCGSGGLYLTASRDRRTFDCGRQPSGGNKKDPQE